VGPKIEEALVCKLTMRKKLAVNTGEKTAFSLRIVGIICLLHSLVYAGNPSKTDPRTPASDDSSESTLENLGDGALSVADYVPNEV